MRVVLASTTGVPSMGLRMSEEYDLIGIEADYYWILNAEGDAVLYRDGEGSPGVGPNTAYPRSLVGV